MTVLWITNIPSPYRVDFFNELGKNCELTVVFEKSASDERDELWKKYSFDTFKGIILKGKTIKTDAAFCPGILRILSHKRYDHIVITNISSPTGIVAVEYLRCKQNTYWIEGDGGFSKSGDGLRERIKTHIISHAHGCFSTGKMHDSYYLTYGADAKKIFRYPFTSIKQSSLDEMQRFFFEGREATRIAAKKELKLETNRRIVLYVGQFIHRKGIDTLLLAATELCRKRDDIDFILIGGTLPKEYATLARDIPPGRLTCLPFLAQGSLKPYFIAADCFVLPTREDIWGLVVNEAMAMGLPVITTDRCAAGLELVGNENGRLIPADVSDALTEALLEVMSDEKQRTHMAEESFRKIRTYTIEQMARTHLNVLHSNLT